MSSKRRPGAADPHIVPAAAVGDVPGAETPLGAAEPTTGLAAADAQGAEELCGAAEPTVLAAAGAHGAVEEPLLDANDLGAVVLAAVVLDATDLGTVDLEAGADSEVAGQTKPGAREAQQRFESAQASAATCPDGHQTKRKAQQCFESAPSCD